MRNQKSLKRIPYHLTVPIIYTNKIFCFRSPLNLFMTIQPHLQVLFGKMRFPNASLNHQIRRFVYAVTPWETSFEKTEDVPDYLNEVRKILMFSCVSVCTIF